MTKKSRSLLFGALFLFAILLRIYRISTVPLGMHIDEAGLQGCAVGGAQVSEKHAGFVVNRGGATFDDVLRLMDDVRSAVLRTSGVELEPEVKIIRG